MSYTIDRSDPTQLQVFVPDASTGTGVNNVSTSLKLVGRGYPNYGQALAENFLHLLENFASPSTPAHPIEGQLWYKTEVDGDTNINNLMIFDGITWISATGIYHQDTDPTVTYSIKTGDMWFSTSENVLRVFNNGEWTQIGPSVSGEAKTGIESYTLSDSTNTNLQYNVVLNWADGSVVSVVSSAPEFIPNTYPLGMDGFDTITPGITVKKINSQLGRVVAKASDSFKLEGIAASSYLRKDDSTSIGQKITGKVVFETPNAAAPENRDGLIVRVTGTSPSDYLQIYQTRPADRNPGAAIFANNSSGGKIIFKSKIDNNLTDVITIDGTDVTFSGNVYADNYNPMPGTLQLFAGSTATNARPGWLVCNGSTATTVAYTDLFNSIGYNYGTGTNISWFHLPNLYTTSTMGGTSTFATTYYFIKT